MVLVCLVVALGVPAEAAADSRCVVVDPLEPRVEVHVMDCLPPPGGESQPSGP